MKTGLIILIIFLVALAVLGFWYFKSNNKPAAQTNTDTNEQALNEKIAACNGIPNGTTLVVKETTREFINLPKDIYPNKDTNLEIKTISGDATAGYVSNGGPYGETMDAKPGCFSYYYELDGSGQVEVSAKSGKDGFPDYQINFVIQK